MGDAGFILAGPVGREVLSFGTIVFAVFASGGQLLVGQIALGSVSQRLEDVLLYHDLRTPAVKQQTLPNALHRHFRHTHLHLLAPSHPRPFILAQCTQRHQHFYN